MTARALVTRQIFPVPASSAVVLNPQNQKVTDGPSFARTYPEVTMLHYAWVFLVIALVAAIFGFTGIAASAAGIAKILFLVFLLAFLISLITGRRVAP